MKRIYRIFVVLLLLLTFVFARLKPGAPMPLAFKDALGKSAEASAPQWQLSWIGSGFFGTYTISNTGQSGVFEPPPGWEYYDGTFPSGMGQGNGRTGEFPRGTDQYYVWGAGLWVGARSEYFDSADDRLLEVNRNFTKMGVMDSLFDAEGNFVRMRRVIKNVRVANTAYYSDQSAISQLWQTDQRINGTTDGKDPKFKGEYMFGQKNKNLEEHQDPWSFFLPEESQYYEADRDTVYRLDYRDINSRRHELLLKNPFLDPDQVLLDPFRQDRLGNLRGDIVSDEDSYGVFGDYIPERNGSFIWLIGYDVQPLGVQITQRTYSWRIDDYLYINYKIKNMNDFPLYDVFVGYFMDNDVGDATDDMIGFDRDLNLGYSYDSDSEEQGWSTSAGYVGSVFVETPRKYFSQDSVHTGIDGIDNDVDGLTDESDEWDQIGLTGFQTWIRSDLGKSEGFGGDVDDNETDHLKYFELALQDSFEVYEEAQDVRQLAASGPFLKLEPGEEINITIAIVAGESLADLKENTREAVKKYQNGYIGPESPPAPELTAQPAHNTVYLSWDDSPEETIDPFTGEQDFAGYRVYRSKTGLQEDWELLAEYDIDDDSTEYEAGIKYKIGNSNIHAVLDRVLTDDEIKSTWDYDYVDDIFKESTYTLEFRNLTLDINGKAVDTLCLLVYDKTKGQSLEYNLDALTEGSGYTIYDGKFAKSYGPIYKSGVKVYFNGIYILISDGEYMDLDDNGIITQDEKDQQKLTPGIGDVFEIVTYKADGIGNQTGLEYSYQDNDLTDGITYYYSVTSFDRGNRTMNIPEMESSFYENIVDVRPQHIGLEYVGAPELSSATYIGTGNTTGKILRGITEHKKLTGHSYEFQFFSDNPFGKDPDIADYGIVIDRDCQPVSMVNQNVNASVDSVVWVGELNHSTIIPGSVTLELSGQYTGTLSDADSLSGALVGHDALYGIVNYGTGRILLYQNNKEMLEAAMTATVSYNYLNIVMKDQTTKEKSGAMSFNQNSVSLDYIYEVMEAGETDTISHGFMIAPVSPKLAVDSTAWSWATDVDRIFLHEATGNSLEPYDFYITFPEEGTHSAFEEFKHRYGDPGFSQTVPWKVWNRSLNIESRSWNPNFAAATDNVVEWQLNNAKNIITVLHESQRPDSGIGKVSFSVKFNAVFNDEDLGISDTLLPPTSEDTLYIFTSRPLKIDDKFELQTTNMFSRKEKITLDDVRVVPNPYYIRADWDTDQYTQHIDFRHLPSANEGVTHVRIFNVAGDLVAHLKKNDRLDNNETSDEEGTVSWDLRNFENLKVTSGLYIYHIECKIDGKMIEHVGKFAIILGP
ncbi:MAG: hypothetical protein JXQ65_09450 [Candidatus Marinimicrobia bacterium]|nr:hypothetical protein [Candidatus Neomarinimicrobiota bacterium]